MDTVLQNTVLLGTGLLGQAIGQRLLQQGNRLTVWNRSPGRCQGLLAAGAQLAPTPSLHLVQQAGVDVETFMAILRGSALHRLTRQP